MMRLDDAPSRRAVASHDLMVLSRPTGTSMTAAFKRPRVGFLTYDLQPFTEDCIFRVATAGESLFSTKAYPLFKNVHQEHSRIPFRTSFDSGSYVGLAGAEFTPEGFASNLNLQLASECVRDSDVVVLYGLLGATAVATAALARLLERPVVAVSQALPAKEERRRRGWVRALKKWLLRQADVHIYQTPATHETLISVYGVRDRHLFFAPFEAGVRQFAPLIAAAAGNRDGIRAHLNLSSSLMALFVGNLHAFKGVPDLVTALAHVPPRVRPRCFFVGPEDPNRARGATRAEYQYLADLHGVGEHVTFLDPCGPASLAQLYVAADLVVQPTRRDTYLKVLAEAALAKKPLITTDVCGAAGFLVVEGENGFIVPAGDIRALAAALERMADPQLRLRMGERSRELVAKCCDADTETRGFVNAISAALSFRQSSVRNAI